MEYKCYIAELTGRQKDIGLYTTPIYCRQDTSEEFIWSEAKPGALLIEQANEYGAMSDTGQDGLYIICKTPGGDWHIDTRAGNCNMACKNCGVAQNLHDSSGCGLFEDSAAHRCWVRHGIPPNITVDKNGVSCSAGAGSINFEGKFHGFLRDGVLFDC